MIIRHAGQLQSSRRLLTNRQIKDRHFIINVLYIFVFAAGSERKKLNEQTAFADSFVNGLIQDV